MNTKNQRGIENLYNELAESVLTAPIEDLEEEIRAEGRDPDKVAEEVRQIMRDAVLMKAAKDIHTMRVCFACVRGRHQVCIDARNTLCDCTHAGTTSITLRDLAYADGYYVGFRHG